MTEGFSQALIFAELAKKREENVLLNAKADIDGYYSTLTAGRAENLIDTRMTGVPRVFTFDTTAGHDSTEDAGTAEIKSIHGRTLVWNQLVGADTVSVTLTDTHVFFTRISGTESRVVGDGSAVEVTSGDAVHDLTLMFGSGSEPATAADFKALFPRADYAYDAGSLLNFTGTGIKTVGFNLLGRTPVVTNSTTSGFGIVPLDRSVFAHVKAGVSYRVKVEGTAGTTGRLTLSCYHEDGTTVTDVNEFGRTSSAAMYFKNPGVLSNSWNTTVKLISFTPTVNMYLALNLNLDPSTGSYDPSTACIFAVWSGYRNDEFEDYWTRTLALPVGTYFPNGMRSVGEVFDELTADKAIQRIGSRAYAQGDEDDPTVLTDGTETLYVLDTPVTTDIESPLNLVYRVDDFGYEQLLPENDDEPETAPFTGTIAYSTDFVRQLANAPRNFTSQATLDELLTAIGDAIGGTFVKTWDASAGKWTFTFEEE